MIIPALCVFFTACFGSYLSYKGMDIWEIPVTVFIVSLAACVTVAVLNKVSGGNLKPEGRLGKAFLAVLIIMFLAFAGIMTII